MGCEFLSAIALFFVVAMSGCTFYTSCPDIPPPVSNAGSGTGGSIDSDGGTGEGGISDMGTGGAGD
jgi:hypothetical protein